MPTQAEYLEQVRGAIAAHAPGADAFLKPNNFWIMSNVLAGELWQIRGNDEARIEAAMPDTATGDFLERWATFVGISRWLASQSKGFITITDTAGLVIPTTAIVSRSDGVQYTVDTDTTIPVEGVVDVPITSVDTGNNVNLASGAPLNIVAPALNVTTGVAKSITGGLIEETDEQLRLRVIERFQNRTNLGSLCGYEANVKDCVPGVSRSWASFTTGVVLVQFMMDNAYADGLPQAGDVAAVQACIDDPCNKILNQTAVAAAPNPQVLDVQFDYTGNIITNDQETAIINELLDYILANTAPGKTFRTVEIQNVLAAFRPDLQIVVTNGDYLLVSNELFTSATIGPNQV